MDVELDLSPEFLEEVSSYQPEDIVFNILNLNPVPDPVVTASATSFFSRLNSDSDQSQDEDEDEDEDTENQIILNCLVCHVEIKSRCQSLFSRNKEDVQSNSLLTMTTLCDVLNMPNVFKLFPFVAVDMGIDTNNKKCNKNVNVSVNVNVNQLFENANYFCDSCASKIFDASTLAEEIKNLQLRQQVILGNLKRSILNCYDVYDTKKEDELLKDDLQYPNILSRILRKTFSQCWAECRVFTPRLKEKDLPPPPIYSRPRPCPARFKHCSVKKKSKNNLSRSHTRLRGPKLQIPTPNSEVATMDVPSPSYDDAYDDDFIPSDDDVSLTDFDMAKDSDRKATPKIRSGVKTQRKEVKKSEQGFTETETSTTTSNIIDGSVTAAENATRKINRMIQCKYCGTDFNDRESLTITDQDGLKWFTCNLPNCTKKFITLNRLKAHHEHTCPTKELHNKLLQEGEGRSWKCDLCDKSFELRRSLKTHRLAVHEQKFNYFCEVCGHGTLSRSVLARHMVVHSSEKRVQCEECGYSCKRPSQLFYHKRIHTNELPHLCSVCGKGYRSNNKLQQHMVSHSTTKDFPCPLCGKLFASKTYVTNHINSFHKKIPRKVNPDSKSRRRVKMPTTERDEGGSMDMETEQAVAVERLKSETFSKPVSTSSIVKEFSYGAIPAVNHVFAHLKDQT